MANEANEFPTQRCRSAPCRDASRSSGRPAVCRIERWSPSAFRDLVRPYRRLGSVVRRSGRGDHLYAVARCGLGQSVVVGDDAVELVAQIKCGGEVHGVEAS